MMSLLGLKRRPPALAPELSQQAPPPPDVVVVEDSAAVQNMVGVLIAKAGLSHALASSLADVKALPLARASCLVLLDLALDRSDAMEVLDHLGAVKFAGRIVPMSGQDPAILRYVADLGVQRGLRMAPPLKKPFKVDALRTILAQHASREAESVSIDFEAAFEGGLLETWFEPSIDLTHSSLRGFEASIRVRDPQRGLLQPSQFVPHLSAEERGKLAALMCREAAKAWERLSRCGLVLKPSFSVSARELSNPALMEAVRSTRPDDVRWPGFMIKIADPHLIDASPSIKAGMIQFQLHKVGYALESFEALVGGVVKSPELKLAEILVEARLTHACDTDAERHKIVSAAAHMAKTLRLPCVAEGVKTSGERKTVRTLGFDSAKGSLFSGPVGYDVFETMLRKREPLGPVAASVC